MISAQALEDIAHRRSRRPPLEVFTPVTRHPRTDQAAWAKVLAVRIDGIDPDSFCETANSLALLCLRQGKIHASIELLAVQFVLVDAGVCPRAADIGALLNLVRVSFRCNGSMTVDQRIGLWSARYHQDGIVGSQGRYAGKVDALVGGTLIEEELRCGSFASAATYGSLLPPDDATVPETLRCLLRERDMASGQGRGPRLPCPLFDQIVSPARVAAGSACGSYRQKMLLKCAAQGLLARMGEIDHRWWRVLGVTVVGISSPPNELRELYEGIVREEPAIDARVRVMHSRYHGHIAPDDVPADIESLCTALWNHVVERVPDARMRMEDYLSTLPVLCHLQGQARASGCMQP